MNSKWYISALVIILALLGGVANQQKIGVANQEIVLQFTNGQITTEESQNAISILKAQLHSVGIDNIQVKEQKEGQLKITYYSDANVASVKRMLSESSNLDCAFTSNENQENPNQSSKDENSTAYNLDVFEIQSGNHSQSDLGGKLALAANSDNIRFVNPDFYVSFNKIDARVGDSLVKTAYNFQNHIAIAIDNSSNKIPEVRAGPIV